MTLLGSALPEKAQRSGIKPSARLRNATQAAVSGGKVVVCVHVRQGESGCVTSSTNSGPWLCQLAAQRMHRLRKHFRGSGRALAFIFVASVIWLIFDMAALKFSFNDVNSRLHREELFKREQGGSESWRPNARRKWGKAGQPRGEHGTKLKGLFHPPGDELGKVVHADPKAMFKQRKMTIKPMAPNKINASMGVPGIESLALGRRESNKLQDVTVTQGLMAKAPLSKSLPKENLFIKENATGFIVRQAEVHIVEKPVEAVQLKVGGAEDSKILDGKASRDVMGAAGSKDTLKGKDGGAKDVGDSKDAVESKDSVEAKEARDLEYVVVAKDLGDSDVRAFKEAKKVKDDGAAKAMVRDTEVSKVVVKDKHALELKIGAQGKAADGSENKVVFKGPSASLKLDRSKEQGLENQRPGDFSNKSQAKKLNISGGVILPSKHNAGLDLKNYRPGFKGGLLGDPENKGVKGTLTRNITQKLANVNISSSINADGENKQLIHHIEANRVSGTGMHIVRRLDATARPRDSNAPGQFGRPLAVPKDKEEEANKRWKEGNFNVYLSDIIPLDRAIDDTRPKGCSNQLVHDDLPSTSIIICFVDEVWSTLLRTVFSALNRSPPELLKEIILVDDFSTRDYLKENLDEYMKQYPKVRILHLKERNGLIRARIAGANIATGDVLTFLDSHVECNVGWLEPLLEQVRVNRKKVPCPVIEVISHKDMSYMTVDNFQRGVFTWPLNFGWKMIPTEDLKKNKITEMDPIKCPVMAGGLFSIDKQYFYELGTYDPGLDVWGGENMEISFKIWMCGGEVEIIPCSRVGHIFRNDNPYSFPKDRVKTVERNLVRVAEVWLDEYKELFYGHGYHLLQELPYIGDLTQQKELRKHLQCKSFKWYLDNVFPDLDAPLVRASGVVANVFTGKCLSLQNSTVMLDACDASKTNQHFNFTWLRLIKQQDLCIGPGDKDKLAVRQCDNLNNSLRWLHKSLTGFQPSLESHFVLEGIPRPTCLEVDLSHNTLRTNACNAANTLQKWQFEKYFAP